MKNALALTAFFLLKTASIFAQNTPAFSNLVRGAALEMPESALISVRPKAEKQDSTQSPATEIWYSELIDDGNVTTVSYHFEKKSRRMVGATIYFWEPVAATVARLYWGAPTDEAANSWEQTNSTGRNFLVTIGDPRELRFELKK